MHFSEDVARIVLEYCTDTVLSVLERTHKMCTELDVYQIKIYIAMDELENQDVIITGGSDCFCVEWNDCANSAQYILSNHTFQTLEEKDSIGWVNKSIPCHSIQQFDELLIEHGIHTTPMYHYGDSAYKFKEEMIDLLTSIKL